MDDVVYRLTLFIYKLHTIRHQRLHRRVSSRYRYMPRLVLPRRTVPSLYLIDLGRGVSQRHALTDEVSHVSIRRPSPVTASFYQELRRGWIYSGYYRYPGTREIYSGWRYVDYYDDIIARYDDCGAS